MLAWHAPWLTKESAMTFEHILVPLDFSSAAEQALHCAVELVHHFQSRLTLLHVIDIPVASELNLSAYLAEMDTAAEQEMETYLDEDFHQYQTIRSKISQ